ncbi:MAG: PDR/VanB family oxidoreductase [Hyphomonadaceae bacterium]|nr:PDR/VanB family oxidoreductase [Hyphomonadaceae bacterium]
MSETALDLIVADTSIIAADVRRLRMARLDGAPLPRFEPGAHIAIAARVDGRTFERHYSLVNSPSDACAYDIAVLRQGLFSSYLHHLSVGAHLSVRTPGSQFALDRRAKRHVLVAGGIGITPLYSFARTLANDNASFIIHYGARSPGHFVFLQELRTWAGERLHLYAGALGQRLDVSRIFEAREDGDVFYACGPTRLIEACRAAAHASGAPLHIESFGAGPGHRAPIRVTLARSGLDIVVPAERSILDVALDHGVMTSFDCRRGECGACLARILAGEVDHRDVYLTAAERGEFMTICVSRAKGDALTLEL